MSFNFWLIVISMMIALFFSVFSLQAPQSKWGTGQAPFVYPKAQCPLHREQGLKLQYQEVN